ncbi:LytR/AlgR family response regulator transcription factor [Aquirufa sp. ROCK-SH2]
MSTSKNTSKESEKKSLKLGTIFVNPETIKFIEGEGNYSIVHFDDGSKRLSCRTLKYFENLLKNFPFIRPSKSYLINTTYIKAVELKSNKSIILHDDIAIGISRRNVPIMKAYFNL